MWRGIRYLSCLLVLMLTLGAQTPAPGAIIFWHHDPQHAEVWAALAADFNAAHAVQVEVQYSPTYIKQHDAILSALVGGGLPDVALVQNYDAALYQLGGALRDLSDIEAAAIYPLFLAQDRHADQQLGVPVVRHAQALYVNLAALRELGYAAPPSTRAELADMACAFRQQGGWSAVQSVNEVGFDLPMDAAFLWALSYPARFFVDERFDFAGLDTTLQFLQDLKERGCAFLNPQPNAQNRFAGGQTLFYFDSTAARPYVEAAIGSYFAQPFDLAVVPIPGQVALWSAPSLSIFAADPQREGAAQAWVWWLAQPAQVERLAMGLGAFPARSDVESGWAAWQDAAWAAEPSFAGYDLVRDEMVFAARAFFNGEAYPLAENANQIYAVFVLESGDE